MLPHMSALPSLSPSRSAVSASGSATASSTTASSVFHSATSASKALFWRVWNTAMLSAWSSRKRWCAAKSNTSSSMRTVARPSRKSSRNTSSSASVTG
ncbi:hypothetical protein G6F31_019892 [Rhizopus arrhizus]|nr:hypothetical protein G6F31_019892 [Rhizopus arrhizus]